MDYGKMDGEFEISDLKNVGNEYHGIFLSLRPKNGLYGLLGLMALDSWNVLRLSIRLNVITDIFIIVVREKTGHLGSPRLKKA